MITVARSASPVSEAAAAAMAPPYRGRGDVVPGAHRIDGPRPDRRAHYTVADVFSRLVTVSASMVALAGHTDFRRAADSGGQAISGRDRFTPSKWRSITYRSEDGSSNFFLNIALNLMMRFDSLRRPRRLLRMPTSTASPSPGLHRARIGSPVSHSRSPSPKRSTVPSEQVTSTRPRPTRTIASRHSDTS